MEGQSLAECGTTIEPEGISSFYNRSDPPKWSHDGDELLDVVRSIVADEGEGRD